MDPNMANQEAPSSSSGHNPTAPLMDPPPCSPRYLISSLRTQVQEVLDSLYLLERPANNDASEDPSATPLLWISKWVDCSDKDGFGYQLSDGSIGVNFNDKSRIVVLPDGIHIRYMDKNGTELLHKKSEYHNELQKKLESVNCFQEYMKKRLLKAGSQAMESELVSTSPAIWPYMWTWFVTPRAAIMVLTNGTMQINDLKDHIKVILCPLMGTITTLDPQNIMKTFKFSLIKEHGCNDLLFGKLQYALQKLYVVVQCNKPNPANEFAY